MSSPSEARKQRYSQSAKESNLFSRLLPRLKPLEDNVYWRIRSVCRYVVCKRTDISLPKPVRDALADAGLQLGGQVLGHCYAKPELIGEGPRSNPSSKHGRRNVQIALRSLEKKRLIFPFGLDHQGHIRYLVFKYPVLDEEAWERLTRCQPNNVMVSLCRALRILRDPYHQLGRALRRGEKVSEAEQLALDQAEGCEYAVDDSELFGQVLDFPQPAAAVDENGDQPAEVAPVQLAIFPSVEGSPAGRSQIAAGAIQRSPLNTNDPSGIDQNTETGSTPAALRPTPIPSWLELEYEWCKVTVRQAQQEHGFAWKFLADCDVANTLEDRRNRIRTLLAKIAIVEEYAAKLAKKRQTVRDWTRTLSRAIQCDWPHRPDEKPSHAGDHPCHSDKGAQLGAVVGPESSC